MLMENNEKKGWFKLFWKCFLKKKTVYDRDK